MASDSQCSRIRAKDTLAKIRTVVENDRTRVYVLSTDGTDGSWWCPGLDNVGEIAWSPDGTRLAVVSPTPKIGHHDVRTTVSLCNQGQVSHVADLPAPTSGLAWADGRTLVFASTTTQVLTPDHLWTLPVDGGAAVDRTPRLVGSATGVVSDPHGTVYVQMQKGVVAEIDRFQDGQLATAYRWPDGTMARQPVFSPFTQAPAALAFTVGDPTHTANVAVNRGGQLVKITHAGEDALSNLSLGNVRVVSWTATDGTHLEAIATFPAGYHAGTKVPFLVLPHWWSRGQRSARFRHVLALRRRPGICRASAAIPRLDRLRL